MEINRDNRRKVLCDAIALIRFPLMTVEEFALGPAQSGTLTERETVDLFLYFTLNPKPRVSTIEIWEVCASSLRWNFIDLNES